jgi:hypothetical protein
MWPSPAEGDDAGPGDQGDIDRLESRPTPAVTGPLIEVDEIYVGCPAIDQILAYRDRDFTVLATVERQSTDGSKVDALLAADGTRHVGERWLVCRDEQPVFWVERYLPAEHPRMPCSIPREHPSAPSYSAADGYAVTSSCVKAGALPSPSCTCPITAM